MQTPSKYIDEDQVIDFIRTLGGNFELIVVGNYIATSTDTKNILLTGVMTISGSSTQRVALLKLIHDAFVKLGIQTCCFESAPYKNLLAVDDTMMLYVRERTLVFAKTYHNRYRWGKPSAGM